MTIESLLKSSASYNLWANSQLVDWLNSKPSEILVREMPSSFPTLRDTLLHIWGAEEIWHERLMQVPTSIFLSFRFTGTTEDVLEGILKQSKALEAYINDLSDADFQEICTFRLLNGTEDSRTRVKMIHHCLNHSTYHRGQVVTMARNFGLTDPPATDYIKYIRLK